MAPINAPMTGSSANKVETTRAPAKARRTRTVLCLYSRVRLGRKEDQAQEREDQKKNLDEAIVMAEVLLLGTSRRSEVLGVIETAADVDEAREKLQALLEIDWDGASAILDLQSRRLSAREREKLMENRDRLVRERQQLDAT